MSEISRKTIQICSVVVAFVLGSAAVYVSRHVLLLALIGIGLGVLVAPWLTKMRDQYRIPKVLSALIFVIGLMLVGSGILYGVSLLVADQIQALSQEAPNLITNLQNRWDKLLQSYPWVQGPVEGIDIKGALQSSLQQVVQGMRLSVEVASGFVLVVVIGLYTAVGSKEYKAGLVRAFPSQYQKRVTDLLSKSGISLRKWLRAQLTDMAIVGAMTLFGLWIVNADYWAVLGVLTGVLGIIPYFGILFVIVLAVLVTFAADPANVPWVLGVFLITQQVEGHLILPMVMREQIELPEMPLLVFILLMGTWFGVIGVFVAAPIFALSKLFYQELYLEQNLT